MKDLNRKKKMKQKKLKIVPFTLHVPFFGFITENYFYC